jgi:hypothetical protein
MGRHRAARAAPMDPALRELLEKHDDPDGGEFPVGANAPAYKVMAESVTSIQRALRDELSLSLENSGGAQDCSFHAEIHVLHPSSYRPNGVIAFTPEIAIRFSNFGRLFTIYSALPELLPRYPVDAIRAIVERHGWTYVPADQLHVIYDGRNTLLRNGVNTWWIRYFDYL